MAAAQPIDPADTEPARIRLVIARCDAKLATYRQALDTGADPAVVTGWIAGTQADRVNAVRQLAQISPPERLTTTEIKNTVTALGDILTVIRRADPPTKPPSTSSSAYSSTTTQTQQRCAPRSISARTVHQ